MRGRASRCSAMAARTSTFFAALLARPRGRRAGDRRREAHAEGRRLRARTPVRRMGRLDGRARDRRSRRAARALRPRHRRGTASRRQGQAPLLARHRAPRRTRDVDHDFAVTEVDQTFVNPSSDTVEGIFSFRTPPGAVPRQVRRRSRRRLVWGKVKESARCEGAVREQRLSRVDRGSRAPLVGRARRLQRAPLSDSSRRQAARRHAVRRVALAPGPKGGSPPLRLSDGGRGCPSLAPAHRRAPRLDRISRRPALRACAPG